MNRAAAPRTKPREKGRRPFPPARTASGGVSAPDPQPPMLAAPDILSRIMRLRNETSSGARRLADVVLNDIEFSVHATTAELARTAQVSVPTVTRFCRMAGCGGVLDFKLALAKTMSAGRRYLLPADERRDKSDIAGQTLNNIHRALDTFAKQLDMKAMRRAAEIIADAGRVFVFGGGGGASIAAQDAEHRLFRLGVGVLCCNDSQVQQMIAATLEKNDVLLAVSTGGRYLEMVKAAEIARQYDAQVVALTAPGAPLARTATLHLRVHIPESGDILTPTASRYALLAAVDIIATLVAVRRGETAREKMRRIKHQLVALRDGEDRQPLGD